MQPSTNGFSKETKKHAPIETRERVLARMGKVAPYVIGFTWGMLVWLLCMVIGTIHTLCFHISKKDKQQFRDARSDIWDLSGPPLPGYTHKFHSSPGYPTLHYVENDNDTQGAEVVIFLHGFPDSWFSWQHQLAHPVNQQKAHLIAVDLPGYGGSEMLKDACTTDMLETLIQFIQEMLAKHGQQKCILVGHDWGAIIGYRLTSEAGFLFKHAILLNGLHPQLGLANAARCLDSSTHLLHRWYCQPQEYRLLRHAYAAVLPFVKQFFKSGYLYAFKLPYYFARSMVTANEYWLLRYTSQTIVGHPEATFLASALGPGHDEIEGYPAGVAQDYAQNGHIMNMLAPYRYNLATTKWHKSIDIAVMESQLGGSIIEHAPGSLLCPATLVYGTKDKFFHKQFCYDGIDAYFGCPGSTLFAFPMDHFGHYVSPGRDAVNEMITYAIDGQGKLKDRVCAWFPEAKVELQL